jgi:hypothetical protein
MTDGMEVDRRYGDLLVRMGLCSKDQVDSGLRELERRLAEGSSSPASLSGVLLERGVLSPVQVQSTIRFPENLPSMTDMEVDRRYGELLVRMALCSQDQVDSGLREVGRRLAEGTGLSPSLSGVLLERGVLSPVQVQSTIRFSDPAPPQPGAPEPVEVAEAVAHSENHAGKYVKVSSLGKGGMGEVWKAWDRQLCRWTALKFLHQEDPEQLARFRREAQMAARLSHPNIAAVYEVGQVGGKQFIAMQFVPGTSLAALGPRKPRLVVELLRDAALAIHYAHEQGTIHRDLKPANLMVVEESTRPRIFILDFGLARPATGDSSVSLTGIVVARLATCRPSRRARSPIAWGRSATSTASELRCTSCSREFRRSSEATPTPSSRRSSTRSLRRSGLVCRRSMATSRPSS